MKNLGKVIRMDIFIPRLILIPYILFNALFSNLWKILGMPRLSSNHSQGSVIREAKAKAEKRVQ